MGIYREGQNVKEFPLKDFAPDLDPATPGILLDMQNAMPTVKGYQCMNSPVAIGTALPEQPIGSTCYYSFAQGNHYFAGGADNLYRLDADWVTVGTGGYGATNWQFAQFEGDLIAVGGPGVTPQMAPSATVNFSPLAGSPPVGASLVLAINSQVMMFAGNAWYVSAIGTDANWTPSTQTQAGSAPLTDMPGHVVEAARLYRGVVAFKFRGIWLGNYVGGSSIWSWSFLSADNGTWGPGCAVELPDSVAFLGWDDFYYTTGYTPQRIPNNIKEWFFDTAAPQRLNLVQSAYDSYHALVYWFFVSREARGNFPDQYVSYNTRAQKWARGYLRTPSVPIPNTMDQILQLHYFDQDNVMQMLNGAPSAMRLRSGWNGVPGKLTQLLSVRPKYSIAPEMESLQTFHVNAIGNPVIPNGNAAFNPIDHWYYMREYDRYHQVELDVSGTTLPAVAGTLDTGSEVAALAFQFREGGDR